MRQDEDEDKKMGMCVDGGRFIHGLGGWWWWLITWERQHVDAHDALLRRGALCRFRKQVFLADRADRVRADAHRHRALRLLLEQRRARQLRSRSRARIGGAQAGEERRGAIPGGDGHRAGLELERGPALSVAVAVRGT